MTENHKMNESSGEPEQSDKKEHPVSFTRHKVLLERNFGDLTLREFENIDVDGAAVLEGFPSEGITSILLAEHIVRQLKLPLIGDIVSKEFPCSTIIRQGIPMMGARVHGNKQMVVLLSEFQLSPSLEHDFTELLFDFVKRHRASMLFTTEGLTSDEIKRAGLDSDAEGDGADASYIEDLDIGTEEGEQQKILQKLVREASLGDLADPSHKPRKRAKRIDKAERGKVKPVGGSVTVDAEAVAGTEEVEMEDTKDERVGNVKKQLFFVTSDQTMGTKLESMGLSRMVTGHVSGVTGGLLMWGPTVDVPITCLLAPTKELLPDTKAAIALLKVIDELLGAEVHFDLTKLVNTGKKIEDKVRMAIEQLASTGALVGVQGVGAPNSMYM